MNSIEYLMLFGVVIFSASGQLLLRHGAKSWITGKGIFSFLRSIIFSAALPALILVLGAPLLYWKALETVPLSQAYAVTALTGVLVQFGASWILGESVTPRIWIGALLCCSGIAIWGL